MGRYGFFVTILGAVIGLAVFGWKSTQIVDAQKVAGGSGTAPGATSPIQLAEQTAAQVRAQQASSAAELYASQRGSYAGMSTAALRRLDPTLDASVAVVVATDSGYCIQAASGAVLVHATGLGQLADGPCV